MDAISARGVLAAAWVAILTNGPLFFLTSRVLDRPRSWETIPTRPIIVLTALSGVVIVATAYRRRAHPQPDPVAPIPIAAAILLGGWATTSALWSLDPSVTLWRGLTYIALPFVAWAIALLRPEQILVVLGLATSAILSFSLFLIGWVPRIGLDHNDDWRGVMTGRNSLGPIAGLGLCAGIAAIVRRRAWGFPLALAGLVTLIGTESRTAFGAAVTALVLASVVTLGRRYYQRKPQPSSLAAGLAAGMAAIAATVFTTITVWNESTFVQRRTIWNLLGDTIGSSPWRGVGWEAFWSTPSLHTDPLLQRGSAHGSIPELLLGVGWPGLLLWLIVVGTAVVGVTVAVWRQPTVTHWLWLATVLLLVAENLTESFVLWFSYNWVLLIAAAARFGPRWPGTATPIDEPESQQLPVG